MAVQTVPSKTNGTPQNLEALIAASLQAVEEAKRQEEARQEARRQALLNEAKDMIRRWLGDLAFLMEQGTFQAYWEYSWGEEVLKRLKMRVDFPEDLQLAPVKIVWNSYPIDGHHVLAYVGSVDANIARVTEARYLLAHARQHWEAWKQYQHQKTEYERQKAIQKWEHQLKDAGSFWSQPQNRQALEDARQKVAQVWSQVPSEFKPELEKTYRRVLEHLREAEAFLARVEAEEAKKRAYIQALARWYREKVLPTRDALRRLKEEVESRDLTVYRVEYGVVAEDEDGDRFVDTRSFYTWQAAPDAAGYFVTVDGRRLRPEHVVLVEEIRTTVGECPWKVQDALPYLDWTGGWGALYESVRIHFHPEEAHRVEELRQQYPDLEPPEPPIYLDFYDKREVFKEAYREATSQEPPLDDLD